MESGCVEALRCVIVIWGQRGSRQRLSAVRTLRKPRERMLDIINHTKSLLSVSCHHLEHQCQPCQCGNQLCRKKPTWKSQTKKNKTWRERRERQFGTSVRDGRGATADVIANLDKRQARCSRKLQGVFVLEGPQAWTQH